MKFNHISVWQPQAILFCMILACNSPADDEIEAAPVSPKIIVYGSTGRVGSRVVHEALERSHRITAVSRDIARVKQQYQNLTAVQGDVLNTESVVELVADHDVLVVSVRGSSDRSKDPEKSV